MGRLQWLPSSTASSALGMSLIAKLLDNIALHIWTCLLTPSSLVIASSLMTSSSLDEPTSLVTLPADNGPACATNLPCEAVLHVCDACRHSVPLLSADSQAYKSKACLVDKLPQDQDPDAVCRDTRIKQSALLPLQRQFGLSCLSGGMLTASNSLALAANQNRVACACGTQGSL